MDAKILEAIPGANPSGANLRYEAVYGEIRARVRRARGEVVPDPDDPNFHGMDVEWRFVIGACRDLLRRRSKDLMLGAWLTEAQLAVDGLAGLRDGLDILRGLVETFWETLYPEMENGDVEARSRILEWLDTQLAGVVRSDSASRQEQSDEETKKTDTLIARVARRQRQRELDACIDSLAGLASACQEKFGVEALEFAESRSALLGTMPADSNLTELLAAFSIQVEATRALQKEEQYLPANQDLDKIRDLLERARREKVEGSPPASVALPPSTPPPAPVTPSAAKDQGDATRPFFSPTPQVPPASSRDAGSQTGAGAISCGYFTAEETGTAATNMQKVDFTLTAPSAVAAGFPFELFVWAHEPQERWTVVERAVEELKVRDLVARTKGPFRISSGTVLSVRLTIPGAVIDEPEDTMVWEGESTCVSFVVTFPELSRYARYSGSAQIYANGVRVARISFVLSAEGMVGAEGMRYRKAFASYASDDRDAVLGRIQGIHKVAPELEVFLDVVSLRSGQNWEKELWRVIPASDIFYLFWSSHARKSEWVEKEWRCALRERGIEFIDPIPLESPHESPPPPELSSLHFNDWELAFVRGKAS